jgi:acetoin:2,6-dichlorophenolindophenol oxidoreductase subunit beta
MPRKTIRQALRETLFFEMRRDPTVIVLGEDIVGGTGCEGELDSWGGPFGITKGLIGEFGPERVRDAPISETAIIGAAAGAALTGLRPVAELMFSDFFGVCFDQLYNQAAKFRYMFGGKARTPMVVRTTYGAGSRSASQHSQSPHAIFTHVPGLKVVMPTNAYDAKGLLLQAIRDDDPVIFMEHKKLYDLEDEVPDEPYTIPFGEANILHEGEDVTIVAFGRMVHQSLEAAKNLAQAGIGCMVVDPRTTSPLDTDTILECVEDTGRLLVVDEGNPRCSIAADIAALAASEVFDALKGPVKTINAPHSPVPYSPDLEELYIPSPAKIEAMVKSMMEKKK